MQQNFVKMADFLESDSYEEDLKITLVHNEFNDTASLTDLTVTGYYYDLNNQKIVLILDFDRSKASIERTDDKNFEVSFDNKPFFVGIKAFCALIKQIY